MIATTFQRRVAEEAHGHVAADATTVAIHGRGAQYEALEYMSPEAWRLIVTAKPRVATIDGN